MTGPGLCQVDMSVQAASEVMGAIQSRRWKPWPRCHLPAFVGLKSVWAGRRIFGRPILSQGLWEDVVKDAKGGEETRVGMDRIHEA